MRGSISIHALTRSATAPFSSPKTCQTISIHALTRSATLTLWIVSYDHSISIHALTRSATEATVMSLPSDKYFNPRTHKECDFSFVKHVPSNLKFQSTHSQGVRPPIPEGEYECIIISIHALTRSATKQ